MSYDVCTVHEEKRICMLRLDGILLGVGWATLSVGYGDFIGDPKTERIDTLRIDEIHIPPEHEAYEFLVYLSDQKRSIYQMFEQGMILCTL